MITKPNFFIVGAPKCGTTALWQYLRSHPDIFMPETKEPKFFGRDLTRVLRRQRTLSEYLDLFREARSFPLVGEASPFYLCSKSAASEIREFSPDAKIIVMVRDPVEMMYSLHAQVLFTGDEDIEDFEEALAAEPDRKNGRRVPLTTGDVERLLYRECARFSEQIDRYIQTFGRERVHVIVFDDLKANPAEVYTAALAFLGADFHQLPHYPRVNESKRLRSPRFSRWFKRVRVAAPVIATARAVLPKPIRRRVRTFATDLEQLVNRVPYQRPPLSPALELRLRQEFVPEVQRLSRLLDRDLSHWTRPTAEMDHGRRTVNTSGENASYVD